MFPSEAAYRIAAAKPDVRVNLTKGSPGQFLTGYMSHYWIGAGIGGIGAAPGTAAVSPTRSTTGAIPFPLSSGPGKIRHVGRMNLGSSAAVAGVFPAIFLFDILLFSGGLSALLTSEQTIGGANTPARGDNDVHELYLVVFTTISGTAGNVTVKYINKAGTTRTCDAVPLGTSTAGGRMVSVPMHPDDLQVKSIVSATNDAAASSAGNWGVMALRRLGGIVPGRFPSMGGSLDGPSGGLPEIADDTCLCLGMIGASATGTSIAGTIDFPEGVIA